ncbi:MAG: hypothetical protein WA091_01355 [Minisyncoccales bacterium]
MKKHYFKILIAISFLVLSPMFASAEKIGDTTGFFVDQYYSQDSKQSVSAVLVKDMNNALFYVDSTLWNSIGQEEKNEIGSIIEKLSVNYRYEIYPTLTNSFGTNGDGKLTVLFYPMKSDAMGYIRTIDGYEKIVNPLSNQRQMVYLNSDKIKGDLLKEGLAHEFMHLITLNQKEKTYGTVEDTWLNEARSEYAITLLGYNNEDKETYLDRRTSDFTNNSSDSLTEWRNSNYDYGIVSLFTHYLVEQYGSKILISSLHSSKKGIESINEALASNKIDETFDQIFSDFSTAIYVNDCTVSPKYCFKNEKLSKVRVLPYSNFLPFSGESNLSINQTIKNWSAQWQKFSGGGEYITFDISPYIDDFFNATYVIKKTSGQYIVNKVDLSDVKTRKISIDNSAKDISSIVFIVSLEDDEVTDDQSVSFSYNISASTLASSGTTTDNTIKLPFTIEKPLNQMNKEELLMVVLKLIIYLLSQGKTIF